MLIEVIITLGVLAFMKKLTNLRAIVVCAIAAYGFAFLSAYGATTQNIPGYVTINVGDSTAVNGTVGFAVCCAVSWLVFHKKINADERRQLAEEADAEYDEDKG